MKFYKSGELPKVPHMYFIYGDGGTGKTTIFKQFKGKKALFTFDQSTDVVEPEDGIDTFFFGLEDVPTIQKSVIAYLERTIKGGGYDAIAFDNMSSLQNMVLENIDGASKDSRQNYQKLQIWFRQLGMLLRSSGSEIYATAHQVDNESSGLDGAGRFKPDMNDKTFNAFTSMFDVVGRIYKQGGERYIDLDPELGNHAKNRADERTLIKADELLNSEQSEPKKSETKKPTKKDGTK